ncbi:mCG144898, partial [Mus musculus]
LKPLQFRRAIQSEHSVEFWHFETSSSLCCIPLAVTISARRPALNILLHGMVASCEGTICSLSHVSSYQGGSCVTSSLNLLVNNWEKNILFGTILQL